PPSGPRAEPAPAAGVAEDGQRATVGERQLEIVAAQRPRRPPAVLDQPLLADGLDRRRPDRPRGPGAPGAPRARARLVHAAGPDHQSSGKGVSRSRRSGTREAESTGRTRSSASAPW